MTFPVDSTTAALMTYGISTSSSMSIQGIQRLPISLYDSTTGTINILNYIAIFFTSYYNTMSATGTTATAAQAGAYFLTNLIVDTTSSSSTSLRDFVIYNSSTNTIDWTNRVLSADIQTETYKDYKASNLKFSATLPSEVPIGSNLLISFSSTALNSSSLCGLMENGTDNVVTDCSISSSIVTCAITKRASTFDMCCYNIYYGTTALTVTSGGKVTFPSPSTLTYLTVTEEIYGIDIYAPISTTWASYEIQNPSEITSATFYAKLNSIKYSYSNTIGGFGKATLDITLPRAPTRGMLLEINGEFGSLQITNVKTRLSATFGTVAILGSNINEGDIFLGSIYTNFDQNGIKLKLKNMLYKCGLTLSRNLSIMLWPVKTENFTNLSVTLSMKSPDGSTLSNSISHQVSSLPSLDISPLVALIQNDFCKITDITPRIIQEYASYTFEIDLSQYNSTLETSKPNEVLIFFPHKYFGDSNPNVICQDSSSYQTCSFIEKSVLAVKFNSSIPTTGESPIQIIITGIINPLLETNNQVYFACTLNETNFTTNYRKTLIRGITTTTEGITYQNDTPNGNIRLLNKFTYHTVSIPESTQSNIDGLSVKGVEPLNPREDPTKINGTYNTLHQFGFTFDIANNLLKTDLGYTITDSPYLIITFPSQYKFHWFAFTIQAKIQAYRLNSADLKTIEPYDNVTISTMTTIGNMIKIVFVENKITLDKYHQYFLLKLFNVPPPVDNTINTTNGTQTTGAFKFLVVNSTKRQIFKTWSNLNTFSKEEIVPTKPDLLLTHNKGFKFEFDQKKWIVDVADKENQRTNYIVLRTGRFMKYAFKVRSTSKLLRAMKVDIELLDNKFKLRKALYEISTSTNSDKSFYVGVSCGETPGSSVARPIFINNQTLNIYNYFMPLAPVEIIIKADIPGMINFNQSTVVRINGSHFVDFTLSEPSFSDLEINWQTSNDSMIENSKIPIGDLGVRTVMRITNPEASDIQTYKVGTPSTTCYQYQYDSISFIIDGIAAIIPNDGVKPSNFEYRNADMDSNIIERNTLKFVFTTEYTQIYIYAVLTCLNLDFPSDEQMKTQNVTESPSVAYFSEILNIQGAADITFKNLIRGQFYKLKVYIESTQGDSTLRTSSSMVIENYTLSNGTVLNLMPAKTYPVQCASYRFDTKPGIQVKEPLRWYWQNKFSSSGFDATGCVTVIDQYGEQNPGLPLFKNQTSCGRLACVFRNYQDSIVNQTSLFISETYILCPKPNPICTTDPINYDEKFNEIYTELNTNQTFKTSLNIEVVPSFALNSISENTAPALPTVNDLKATGNTVKFTTTSDRPSDCAFIVTTGATPTQNDFDNCNTSICTYINVSTQSTVGEIKMNPDSSGTYTLFVQCKNEVPCSAGFTDSSNLGTVNLQGGSNVNNNSTASNSTNTTESSSVSYISLNMVMLLLMLCFLLN